MKITVVWADFEVQDVVTVEVPPGATVADAVERSALLVHHRVDPARLGYAIFGRRVDAQTRLADNDRVELTRPLTTDPKEMRRHRARIGRLESPAAGSKRRRAE